MTLVMMTRSIVRLVTALAAVLAVTAPALAQAPRHGGVLNLMQREELPQGLSIHESSTIATVWPASGELAEKWSWQDNYRNLVLFLRKGVRWHSLYSFGRMQEVWLAR